MPSTNLTFPPSARLGGKVTFSAVFDARTKSSSGPLTLYSLPNTLAHSRLGISISRRVGNAVKRNRIKRLLREAFRLDQHTLPQPYDWVIVVRPHQALTLADYRKLLAILTLKCHAVWRRNNPSAEIDPA